MPIQRSSRTRKLQIAWSVACLITSMMLIVLWARSYWAKDIVGYLKHESGIYLGSSHGVMYLFLYPYSFDEGASGLVFTSGPAWKDHPFFKMQVQPYSEFLLRIGLQCYSSRSRERLLGNRGDLGSVRANFYDAA